MLKMFFFVIWYKNTYCRPLIIGINKIYVYIIKPIKPGPSISLILVQKTDPSQPGNPPKIPYLLIYKFPISQIFVQVKFEL